MATTAGSQADSGHETLLSDDDTYPPLQQRSSSEVIYSSLINGSSSSGASIYARSRRSLAEAPSYFSSFKPIISDTCSREEVFHSNPPNITPIGGVPNVKGKTVLRPIAYRPGPPPGLSSPGVPCLLPGHSQLKDRRRHYGSSQELHASTTPSLHKFNSLDRRAPIRRMIPSSILNSSELESNNRIKEPEKRNPSTVNSAMNINGLPSPLYSSQESLSRKKTLSSYSSLLPSYSVSQEFKSPRMMSTCNSGLRDGDSTPSPSDSAIGDLESMLKDKDSEIVILRETMEQNEHVIFKVYEEKERNWERELRKIKSFYENRVRANQSKFSKMELALTNKTYQLQNDKRKLEREIEEYNRKTKEIVNENERLKQEHQEYLSPNNNRKESNELGSSENNQLISELHFRNSQIAEYKEEFYRMKEELSLLRGLVESQNEEDYCASEYSAQKSIIIERDVSIEKLENKVKEMETEKQRLVSEFERERASFENEKASWLSEKEKVIRYQKQLQLNYVQMYRKNKVLESENEESKKKWSGNSGVSTVSTSLSHVTKSAVNTAKTKFFKMTLHSETQC